MTLWPFINILIGLYCAAAGLFEYEKKVDLHFFGMKLSYINIGLGVINLSIGLFFIVYLNLK